MGRLIVYEMVDPIICLMGNLTACLLEMKEMSLDSLMEYVW